MSGNSIAKPSDFKAAVQRSNVEQVVLPASGLAVLLCRQDELSYEEIARVLGLSLSATKSLIHRARETLKNRLKPYLQTGSWQADPAETMPIKRCL